MPAGEPPPTRVIDLALFAVCLALPWLATGWWHPLVAVAALGAWFVVVRPGWRGLAPFYMTATLALHVLVTLAVAILR